MQIYPSFAQTKCKEFLERTIWKLLIHVFHMTIYNAHIE